MPEQSWTEWVDSDVDSSWPEGELENVDSCPLCDEGRGTTLHGDLSDRVFRTAPGRWTIWRCVSCGVGYLSPRPTEASIGLAYRQYYTHERKSAGELLAGPHGALRKLALTAVNGRLKSRLGYERSPSSRIGGSVMPLFVRRDRELLARVRFVKARPGGCVLDVGCGDGDYLMVMRSLGWEVAGVDPDPRAVADARESGLDVRLGTLSDGGFPSGHFDVVTLCHVIEHVHDPIQLLAECRRVLAPGGELIVMTPNLDSEGHRRFGADWLHLDPPRHLVIFTVESLRRALASAGFADVQQLPVRLRGASAGPSEALRRGGDPTRPERLGLRLRAAVTSANLRALRDPARAEEVALRAISPPGPRDTVGA